MRRLLTGMGLALILISLFSAVYAANADTITIEYPNGNRTALMNGDYMMNGGTVYIKPNPMLGLLPFAVPGKGIWWIGDEKKLVFAFMDTDDYMKERFSIKVGEHKFMDNGNEYELRQEAVLQDGRVYLPVRAIAEAYGYSVHYANNNGTIVISIQGEISSTH
ncbi:copper amine oxidase N-terminal domain-containing protein [Xylanibacillus composti]|uniref:Copper amine oxidase-like N-terminal domain-containing protein n=1 Tax=Xylanibacillus composti TaxID=1572762 RepID=A0A8J4M3T8_9BACL|nr:copper amine oxidase N-terminal domain-containing protein [Xylanibacillus composti]MDT9725309.1 copper amine oxidase N-terminal domain-containing protein [Xylanibacillus composti]GIQ71179.1 hypothetical protein XYCOK13_40030 [Xylanibacillus composti]